MIWSELIYWFIGISCLLMGFAAWRNFGIKSLWLGKSLLILGLCIVTIKTGSFRMLTIGLWLVLYLIPILGFNYLQPQVARGKYGSAWKIAKGLSFFHPGDGWPDYPDILHALMLVQSGQRDLGMTILKRFQKSYNPMALHAMITMFRIERRWQDCLDWIESLPSSVKWSTSPALLTAYGRSLGELQDYPRFFELIESNWANLQQHPKAYRQLTLLGLAFSGQWQELQTFFKQPGYRFLAETQSYWLATAAMTAGHVDFAQAQFQQLRDRAQDTALKQAAIERLRSPLKPSTQYIPDSFQRKLHLLKHKQMPAISRYDFGQRQKGLFWVTWTILVANVGMFILTVQGFGADRSFAMCEPMFAGRGLVLCNLGGILPPAVWAGEYWRLIAANFLHADVMHLTLNMVGLLILGPYVERVFGWFRFFLVYGLSGLGAAICIAYLPVWFNTMPEFTVGASGAIMGLVGSVAAITLWGWVVDRATVAAKRFQTILIMIGIQIAYDFSNPQISKTGHLSGLVIGFLVTLLIIVILGFKESSVRPSRSLG